jgi:hypothetical protein
MWIAKRTLLTLLAGVLLAATAIAQRPKPNIGQVLIVVKDVATKAEIGSVEPGGTIDLPAGTRVRLIMSALPTGGGHGPLYPVTTFSETATGGVAITRTHAENSSADVEIPRGKNTGRIETIRYQIADTWVPADLRTGSFRIRIMPPSAAANSQVGGAAVFSTRAEQLTRLLYNAILLRDPDPGAQGFTEAIAKGDYGSLVEAAVDIANSQESRIGLATTTTPEQRLTSLYRNLLGLTPEQADPRQWAADLQQLRQGHIGDVVSTIVQSDRFRERNNLAGVRY